MSRTYKCTKGNSKRLKPYFYRKNIETWGVNERGESIDYNDGVDKDYARSLRKGYQQNPPKYFRKMLKKSENARVRNYLYNCKVDEDYWDTEGCPIFREDAGWLWF